ncbi:hypothetical protein [Aquimarina sp. AU58]|uniref:hypothetical protein n=1 Tax=Aquimarina sp. AU58 TaxID=1874112 RepID=UPI000D6DF8D7|nr:hypothetical protein [Aquimarina sp. AU58]
MDFIKSKLSSIGSLLFLMGLVSTILSIFNYNLKLLIWIDLWGTFMGWVIRIFLIIGGAAIYLYTAKDKLEN